jgi:hypothetical protein
MTTPAPEGLPNDGGLYDTLQELIPEGHDSCHVDSSCAGGPEPCAEGRPS